jgi:hypothetical protein
MQAHPQLQVFSTYFPGPYRHVFTSYKRVVSSPQYSNLSNTACLQIDGTLHKYDPAIARTVNLVLLTKLLGKTGLALGFTLPLVPLMPFSQSQP